MRGRYEDCWWEARPGAIGGRRAREPFAYKAFVPDPVADCDLGLGPHSLAAVTEASVALAQLNSAASAAPAEGLARQLVRAESRASSRIEGLELSHRRLAHAAFRDGARDPQAVDVAGNLTSMEHAIAIGAAGAPFTVADVQAIHESLLRFTRQRSIAGVIRTQQNWIGRRGQSPREAAYVPPPPAHVVPLMEDLCSFMNRDDMPGIVQAAIAHGQFETIHPFADGNGRVGRCLIHTVLIRRGLAPRCVPPISVILAARVPQYIEGLGDFRQGPVEDWIEVFADATALASRQAERLADEIKALAERWVKRLGRSRRDSSAYAIISALPAHPVIDVATAQRLAGVSDVAAGRALERLERAGVVARTDDRRRGRVWEAREVFELLSELEHVV